MKKSTPLGDKTKNFSGWYNTLLSKAELVDNRYGVKGFIVYRPNIMFLINRIYSVLEKELMQSGHKPMTFPVLIPASSFEKEAEHIKGFGEEVFKVTKAGGKELVEELILRPTSETAIYPLYALWIRSRRDLPLRLYQSVSVYRAETRSTKPLLRGREFLWIEAHDAFADRGEALDQVRRDLAITSRVCKDFGLPFLMVEREPQDRFPGAESSYAFDTLMPDGKVLQIATTHFLGQKFSDPKVFDIRYTGSDGKQKHVHQTCFGPGVSRIAAAIIAVHGDDYGLVLPFKAAHTQAVIIPIPSANKNKDIVAMTKGLFDELSDAGFRVELDEGEETPGEKFYKWEMLGAPLRIEVGERELAEGYVTVFNRVMRQRLKVESKSIVSMIKKLESEMLDELSKRASSFFEASVRAVKSRNGLLKEAKRGGILKASFCGEPSCADSIKTATGGLEVRGRRIDKDEQPNPKCVFCEEKAKRVVYIAKAY